MASNSASKSLPGSVFSALSLGGERIELAGIAQAYGRDDAIARDGDAFAHFRFE
jgi:hypothetical protein